MAENSGIEWTHHTFNPWIGCTKVSAACDHCYAEAWDARGMHSGPLRWGPRADRTRTKTWGKPLTWQRKATAEGRRYRVFCASLADVFDNHKSIMPEWRADLWALIKQCPDLDFLMLTKRPQNIDRYLPDDWGFGYPNVWLGATVEDQKSAEQRIHHLLNVKAKVHFLSCEPLIGPLDLTNVAGWVSDEDGRHPVLWDVFTGEAFDEWGDEMPCGFDLSHKLDWVITGGESGYYFRPAKKEWFTDLRDQCGDHGTAFLFKQWEGKSQKIIKAKGRELDGVIHDGYPTPA